MRSQAAGVFILFALLSISSLVLGAPRLQAGVALAQPVPTQRATPTAQATVVSTPQVVVGGAADVPQFTLGFAFLKQQLGPIMGVPLEPEHGVAGSCDTQQRTSAGLAYWRCSANAMTFAAAPDGLHHWAWAGRLVTWTGPSPDPPPDARAVVPLIVTAAPPDASCETPAEGPVAACVIANGLTLPGYIQAAGQTDAYRFTVQQPSTRVVADLTDLPADYDLYLSDASGTQLAASVQDGTTPEHIEMTLGVGVYYLYVHDDPSRPFDSSTPFKIHLSLLPSGAP